MSTTQIRILKDYIQRLLWAGMGVQRKLVSSFGRDSKARKLNNGVWVGGVDGVGLSSD